MTTTFPEARDALTAHLATLWGVVVDSPVLVVGGASYVVDRATGTVSEVSYLDNFERFDRMTPTGAPRPVTFQR